MRVWVPTVSMLFVSLISYIDRNTLALLAPTILAETHLSAEQYGYIISAFSVAYMIGNPVWGLLLDRVGLRGGMFAAVSMWTVASASHAFAGGLVSFAAARAALGFGEGATFPGGLRTAVQTLEPRRQSRGIAVAYSGGSLGAIVTPLLITPIAGEWGWRGAFWFTGMIGVAWLALWAWVSRSIRAAPALRPRGMPDFRDARLWAFMAVYSLGAAPLAFVLYGTSLYLSKAMGQTQQQIGSLLWIPPLGWEIGYFFWGWVSDRFRRTGAVSYQSLFAALTMLSFPLALGPSLGAVTPLMAGLFFAMFIAAGFVILPIAYATEAFPAHSGFIAGAGAGSWSAMVALVMPLFGRLFDRALYFEAFAIASALPVAGLALWWWLDQRHTHQQCTQATDVISR